METQKGGALFVGGGALVETQKAGALFVWGWALEGTLKERDGFEGRALERTFKGRTVELKGGSVFILGRGFRRNT